ncbi:MAG: aminotransferase class IV [Chlamydiales bacterium]|nr:aminotransferase class IV [Chlamydiales bacterium]
MFFIDGLFVRPCDAKISVLDLSILRGFAVFDYLRTYKKKPFHLKEHLKRLAFSAQNVGIALPYPLKKIEEIILSLLEQNDYPETSIKILLTGGVSPDHLTPQKKSTLIILAYPLEPLPQQLYEEGISVITTRQLRSFPIAKTTQYMPAIVALEKGKSCRAKDALYVNSQEEILEATTSNFFAVKNNTLYTPISDQILTGITREVVLKLAQDHFDLCFEPILLNHISDFEEAFLTGSTKEILPVTEIDAICLGKGKIGPNTRRLMELFQEYVAKGLWPELPIDFNARKDLSAAEL